MTGAQRDTVARLVAVAEKAGTKLGCLALKSTTESRGVCSDRTDREHNPSCLAYRATVEAGHRLLAEHAEPVQGKLLEAS